MNGSDVSKPGRRWFPLDVNFTVDDKILDAGERSGWLYLAMLGRVWGQQRPGVLTRREVAALGVPSWEKRMPMLLKIGLVEQRGDEYIVAAWPGWAQGRTRAEYMREYRARKRDA